MDYENVQWKIAGINHQAWLLEITKDGDDLIEAHGDWLPQYR